MNNDEYRAYREKMRSIPSKRGDLRLQAEASVEGPGFMLTAIERLSALAQARTPSSASLRAASIASLMWMKERTDRPPPWSGSFFPMRMKSMVLGTIL